jgi:DNA-directed RNA polymerase II subunit RPB1
MDEMNIQTPQSYQSKIELEALGSTEALIKSPQSARLLLSLCQDALTGGYLLTRGEYREIDGKKTFFGKVKLTRELFYDICCSPKEWDMEYISNKFEHIERIVKKWNESKKIEEEFDLFCGHYLVSMLFPDDFCFSNESNKLIIINGVMVCGYLTKTVLAEGHSSLVHKLEKEYGAQTAIDFVSNYQFFINDYLCTVGFSIGLKDCVPSKNTKDFIDQELSKSFIEAEMIMKTENDMLMREAKINNCLNNATTVGQKISKESMSFDNALNVMVLSGAKGHYVNISQIVGFLGQQNVDGKRIPKTYGNRTLPHYSTTSVILKKPDNSNNDLKKFFESQGFISDSYLDGLSPQSFFFHCASGREGLIDTSQRTAISGYIQSRIVKKLEDMKISYNDTVVGATNNIIQFSYGNSFNPARTVMVKWKPSFTNVKNLAEKLNVSVEYG